VKLFNVDQPTMLLVLEAFIPFKTMADPYVGLPMNTNNFVETTKKIGTTGRYKTAVKATVVHLMNVNQHHLL